MRRTSPTSRTGVVLAMAVAFAFVAASCGGEDSAKQIPDVTVYDVGADTEVELASFVPASSPLLVWFWAPH